MLLQLHLIGQNDKSQSLFPYLKTPRLPGFHGPPGGRNNGFLL